MDHHAINNNNHRQVTWLLQMKFQKRDSQDDSDDVFSNWYERVDNSATPGNFFGMMKWLYPATCYRPLPQMLILPLNLD